MIYDNDTAVVDKLYYFNNLKQLFFKFILDKTPDESPIGDRSRTIKINANDTVYKFIYSDGDNLQEYIGNIYNITDIAIYINIRNSDDKKALLLNNIEYIKFADDNIVTISSGGRDDDISANDVKFADGQTFQEKYANGDLRGPQGPKGETGASITYKGNCQYAELPAEGNNIGDIWYCSDGINGIGNYSWDGTKWNFVGDENNNIQKVQSQVDSIEDATCDVTIISDNYNLLKYDECSYSSTLSVDSAGIVSSNSANLVTGIIPVKYGKYYGVSFYENGARTIKTKLVSSTLGKVNAFTTDGTELYDMRGSLSFQGGSTGLVYSDATIYINRKDIVSVRMNIWLPNINSKENALAKQIMIVEGDSKEDVFNKGLNSEFIAGDEIINPTIVRTLKHDDTKADASTVSNISKNVELINERKQYDINYIQNQRFIKSISNLRDESKSKDISISITNNSTGVIKNATIAIGLHNKVGIDATNNNMPFQIYDDIFDENIGFRFFDGTTELPYYIESECNCNYISDKNMPIGQRNFGIFSNGTMIKYTKNVQRIQVSSDDGNTWTNICTNITSLPYRVFAPDSQDNLFVSPTDGYKLYKYTSTDGYMEGTEVLDLTDEKTNVGLKMDEDSLGNLYLGTYQASPWKCVIRKSTDHGNTWNIVFSSTDNQHVHNIYVNKKVTPNEIFIGLDGWAGKYDEEKAPKCYVSKDYGETWTIVPNPYYDREYSFRYAGENFYIGCGERNILGGATLYKTSDYMDPDAYYSIMDNGQGIRDVTNVFDNDDVLIAGGCVGDPVMYEQLIYSEDRGETWKTIYINPLNKKADVAGMGLREFSKYNNQILSHNCIDYITRFYFGDDARTTLVFLNVGDIPITGKTITLKTGYIANMENMKEVVTSYENTTDKVADIQVKDGYVIDKVSNKRIITSNTKRYDANIVVGKTCEPKIIDNHAYRLYGTVNMGKLSRLNFTKGFTVSLLFRRRDNTNNYDDYISDTTKYNIFKSGTTKLVLCKERIYLMSGETNIYAESALRFNEAYVNSYNNNYIRLTAYFTNDDLPSANLYTDGSFLNDVSCTSYPITTNLSDNDFIIGDDTDNENIPNIARIEIWNRVLSYGEIMSLTNGYNLVTNGSRFR